MKTAILTGASSGIGFEISKVLLRLGYKVYGIGRSFTQDIDDEDFIPIVCDLTKTSDLEKIVKKIKKDEDVSVLVNNAGVGYFGLHETLSPQKIHQMVATNLEAPLILTQLLLRDIKKNSGFIINISSITAKGASTYGCAYGATKAGITHFSNSLFHEARKYGVKVVAIHPDMTKSNFYRNADFKEAREEETYIMPEEVAKAVEMVLSQREGLVVTDITLNPQKHRIQRRDKEVVNEKE